MTFSRDLKEVREGADVWRRSTQGGGTRDSVVQGSGAGVCLSCSGTAVRPE